MECRKKRKMGEMKGRIRMGREGAGRTGGEGKEGKKKENKKEEEGGGSGRSGRALSGVHGSDFHHFSVSSMAAVTPANFLPFLFPSG